MRFIVTGGMGFFGSLLMEHLAAQGHDALSIDWITDPELAGKFRHAQVDIADSARLKEAIQAFGPADGIFHVAAVLAHDTSNFDKLHASNIQGTRNVMAVSRALGIPKVVFTSSNCVFASGFPQPVDETAATSPIEEYGRSKLEGEKIVASYDDVAGVSIRCPTIIAPGRLGLLSILFDFIREGRRIYVVGDGSNRYSFINGTDLANACLLAMTSQHRGVYHVGSDDVPSIRRLYSELAEYAGKKPKIVPIPEGPTILALRMLNNMGLSPLGPYHYRMLAANFVFETSKIKRELGWSPSKTNTQMLCDAYKFYVDNLTHLQSSSGLSPHRSPAKAGILNLIRMLS
jgi:UDP-glucose 4-epimerase